TSGRPVRASGYAVCTLSAADSASPYNTRPLNPACLPQRRPGLCIAEGISIVWQFFTRLFGSRNQRLLKAYGRYVSEANGPEPAIEGLTDEQPRARTEEFRKRLAEGATLTSIIPEAFACVREAARRTLGMRHFDVQLIGGLALHEGKIAEMRTGEGK